MNPLNLLMAVVLVLLLPGYTLTRAIFPVAPASWRHPGAMVLFLTVSLSVAITILAGALLAFLPHPEGTKGWFQGAATGMPVLEATLLGLSFAFFLAGIARGAYPRLHAPPRARAARERAREAGPSEGLDARVRGLARPGDVPASAMKRKGRRKDR